MQTAPGRDLEALAGAPSARKNQQGLRLGRTIWIWLPVLSCPKVYSCARALDARSRRLPKKCLRATLVIPHILDCFPEFSE